MRPADLPIDRRTLLIHGIGIILLASCMFGIMAVCVRLAAPYMAVTQIAFVRFAGSLAVLMLATRGRGLRPRHATWWPLTLRGLLGAGAILLYYVGIATAGAGFATLIHCTHPVSTAAIASIFLGEQFSRRQGLALVLSLVGVGIVLRGAVQVSAQVVIGGIAALAASILSGGAVVTAQHLRGTESAAVITTYFMVVGAMITAPTLLADLPPLSAPLAYALIGVVGSSVCAQWLLHHGLGYTSATQGSLAAATSVVTASVLEAVIIHQYPSRETLLGACLMIFAIGLAASQGQRATPARAKSGMRRPVVRPLEGGG